MTHQNCITVSISSAEDESLVFARAYRATQATLLQQLNLHGLGWNFYVTYDNQNLLGKIHKTGIYTVVQLQEAGYTLFNIIYKRTEQSPRRDLSVLVKYNQTKERWQFVRT